MQMNESARDLYMACGKGPSTTSVSVELLLMEYDDATAQGTAIIDFSSTDDAVAAAVELNRKMLVINQVLYAQDYSQSQGTVQEGKSLRDRVYWKLALERCRTHHP